MFWRNRTLMERAFILLVVFIALMGMCATARAQQAPLPESPDKAAVGPPVGDVPLRNAEDAACRTALSLHKLYPFDAEHDWQNRWLRRLNETAREMQRLCEEQRDLLSPDPNVRRMWIMELASYDFQLMRLLVEATPKALTKSAKSKLTKFEDVIALLHFDAHTLLGIELHRLAKPREVVRTVEVPSRCPDPPPVAQPPVAPPDPCEIALRQGAGRWASQLYKWTDWYKGSGSDWQLADSSKNDLRAIANGNGDPRSYIIGWLAQWRSIRRQDSTSLLGSGPMPQVAADMRAQLASCGIYGEER